MATTKKTFSLADLTEISLTEKEMAMVLRLVANEFSEGDPTRPAWSWSVLLTAGDKAVFGSLIRKDLAWSEGHGDERQVGLSLSGRHVWQQLQDLKAIQDEDQADDAAILADQQAEAAPASQPTEEAELQPYDVLQVLREGHQWEDFATLRDHDDFAIGRKALKGLMDRHLMGPKAVAWRVKRGGEVIASSQPKADQDEAGLMDPAPRYDDFLQIRRPGQDWRDFQRIETDSSFLFASSALSGSQDFGAYTGCSWRLLRKVSRGCLDAVAEWHPKADSLADRIRQLKVQVANMESQLAQAKAELTKLTGRPKRDARLSLCLSDDARDVLDFLRIQDPRWDVAYGSGCFFLPVRPGLSLQLADEEDCVPGVPAGCWQVLALDVAGEVIGHQAVGWNGHMPTRKDRPEDLQAFVGLVMTACLALLHTPEDAVGGIHGPNV